MSFFAQDSFEAIFSEILYHLCLVLLLLTVDSGVFMISINTATEAGIVYKFCSEGLRPAMHSFHNSKRCEWIEGVEETFAISNSFSLFYARELHTNRCIRDLYYFCISFFNSQYCPRRKLAKFAQFLCTVRHHFCFVFSSLEIRLH